MFFEEIISNLHWSIISEERIYSCIEIQQALGKMSSGEIEMSNSMLIVPFYICKNARLELYEYQISVQKGLTEKEHLRKYFTTLLTSEQIKNNILDYLGEFSEENIVFSVY